ncbi:MAG: hypothetical protein LBD02_00875 [Christensenellaceae bacterium]|jgi:hypothetical protein|nr:hypothetical protein [Christensenellaceae bacterium]
MAEPTVDSLVKSTLAALGVPVARLRYKGKANTYITFQLVLGRDAAFADDEDIAKEQFYRADIYSKTDYVALVRQAERALKQAGFYGITVNAEAYENDTGFYHVPLEFYFMEV